MSRKRTGLGRGVLLALAIVGASGLVALGAYVKFTPADKVPPELHRIDPDKTPSRSSGLVRSTDETTATPVEVLVPRLSGEQLELKKTTTTEDPKAFVVSTALSLMKVDKTTVKSVTVESGVAKVDLEGDVPIGIGSDQESILMKAIQMGLGQFPEVDHIQFVSSGQPLETLGGHLEVTDPVSVIRPGQSQDPTPVEGSAQP